MLTDGSQLPPDPRGIPARVSQHGTLLGLARPAGLHAPHGAAHGNVTVNAKMIGMFGINPDTPMLMRLFPATRGTGGILVMVHSRMQMEMRVILPHKNMTLV